MLQVEDCSVEIVALSRTKRRAVFVSIRRAAKYEDSYEISSQSVRPAEDQRI